MVVMGQVVLPTRQEAVVGHLIGGGVPTKAFQQIRLCTLTVHGSPDMHTWENCAP